MDTGGFDNIRDEDGDIHIVPDDDYFVHPLVEWCPCGPIWDEKNKRDMAKGVARNRIIIHNRMRDPENQH